MKLNLLSTKFTIYPTSQPGGLSGRQPAQLQPRYAYGANNPYKYTDRTGAYAEVGIELVSITFGFHSLLGNLQQRNWNAAVACDFVFVSQSLAPHVRDMRVDVQTRVSDHQPVLLVMGA